MKDYKPKNIRPLRIAAMFVRLLARLIKFWPLLLIVVGLVSPITPHLRWDYRYQDVGGKRFISSCRYVGVHGFTSPDMSECPLISFIYHTPFFLKL